MGKLFSLFLTFRKATYKTLGFVDQKVLHQKNPLFILSYHSVATDEWRFSVDEEMVKEQILYLKQNFAIIPLSSLVSYLSGKTTITKPSVVITIDDGYKDVLKLQSFFKENDIVPTLFVLSNPQNPNWKELGTKRPFLTISEIKELKKSGWEIGCHSATHANLATASTQELQEEIIASKQLLEKELGFTLPYFAYPRGKYNQNVVRYVRQANYQLGLTMDDGAIVKTSDVYTLPRIGIDRSHSFSEFKTTISPSVVRFRKVIKRSPVGKYL